MGGWFRLPPWYPSHEVEGTIDNVDGQTMRLALEKQEHDFVGEELPKHHRYRNGSRLPCAT